MSEQFVFNEITNEDIENYVSISNVFNLSEEDILKEKIELASFSDERLGASEEKLDVALFYNNSWNLLDIEDKIKDYNEIPLGYILDGEVFSRVLVLIRRMSTVLVDRKKGGFNSYILCKVPDKYKSVSQDKALFGLLAKNQVYLDGSEEEIKSQIQSKIVDRNEEICSRLFK